MYIITEDNRLVHLPSKGEQPNEVPALFLVLQKEERELARLTEQAEHDPCI